MFYATGTNISAEDNKLGTQNFNNYFQKNYF